MSKLKYVLKDVRKTEIKQGEVDVNAFGSFSLILTLPDAINLGRTYLVFSTTKQGNLPASEYTHKFEVQEVSIHDICA
jgi:hypothetical protein